MIERTEADNQNIELLMKRYPILKQMKERKEITWINPEYCTYKRSMEGLDLSCADIRETEARLLRFAPFIEQRFPETAATHGIIESPLHEIPHMKTYMNETLGCGIEGRLFLKMDSHLAVAGSVKARGGIHEILKHAEELALCHGKIHSSDNYIKFAEADMQEFLSHYTIHVGSTGNLGLSIGIISAALGFRVNVHMSSDAKEWKKKLLRKKGVNVIEYAGDYGKAVTAGRALAEQDVRGYFVDDENSRALFLGYAVAAFRLQRQLQEMKISVDKEHPLFVYIPCGVGGAPGGITFGLKQIYGDNVYIFFEEPVEACCMALGMITGLHNEICVQDIGLTGKTEADGLAVGRPSRFVGKTIKGMLAGEFTVQDETLFLYLNALMQQENIFIEPSSCAAFEGPGRLWRDEASQLFLRNNGIESVMKQSTQIVWATGGSLVPEAIRKDYMREARFYKERKC